MLCAHQLFQLVAINLLFFRLSAVGPPPNHYLVNSVRKFSIFAGEYWQIVDLRSNSVTWSLPSQCTTSTTSASGNVVTFSCSYVGEHMLAVEKVSWIKP